MWHPWLAAIALAACFLVAGLASPRDAGAGETQLLLMEDEHRLLESTRAEQLRTLDQMQSLGVDRIRVVVWWRYMLRDPLALEPPSGDLTDPASLPYDPESWAMLDSLVREARARGIHVILNPASASAVAGTILHLPRWAKLPSG